MKRILLIALLSLGTYSNSSAFITKADIESMMTEIGTSLDKISEVFVGNTMSYFNDGTKKETFDKYTKEKGNVVVLTDTGIKVVYKPSGVTTSVFFIPYSSIITFDIGKDYITLYVLR